jgi:hypothetical protein
MPAGSRKRSRAGCWVAWLVVSGCSTQATTGDVAAPSRMEQSAEVRCGRSSLARWRSATQRVAGLVSGRPLCGTHNAVVPVALDLVLDVTLAITRWGEFAWMPITAARLMRARRGRLLLIVAERHCR